MKQSSSRLVEQSSLLSTADWQSALRNLYFTYYSQLVSVSFTRSMSTTKQQSISLKRGALLENSEIISFTHVIHPQKWIQLTRLTCIAHSNFERRSTVYTAEAKAREAKSVPFRFWSIQINLEIRLRFQLDDVNNYKGPAFAASFFENLDIGRVSLS